MAEQIHPTLDEARHVLQQRWGHAQFRPGQDEIIEAILAGRDVLGVLPTGGGKSICYQLPALVRGGFTLVVSPLIALMQDQVAGLRDRGVAAGYINSTLSHHEIDQRWTDAEFGRYDLLYLAPERLQSDLFLARAERFDVSLLAVDEAHCISEWGHHFRPDYLRIPEARTLLGNPQTVAVTATATPAVRRDIVAQLDLRDPAQIVRGFDRPNLVWSVFRTDNKRAKVRDVIDGVAGSGIVYAATRRAVERWARWLDTRGESAAYYHGGMDAGRRESTQEDWVAGDTRIMVATNAFGMGIDKPDVRFVVHVDLPASIEAYYQEAGRAGRDGRTAYAVLLFQPPDADTQKALIEASHPTAKEVREVYDAVCNVGQVPIGSIPDGPLAVNEEAVLRLTGFARAKVRMAIELLDRQEAWQVQPRRRHIGLIRFAQSADAVRRYAQSIENRALSGFVRTLLRTVHADAYSEWWRFDLRLLERRTGLERERLLRGLRFLEERGLIHWRPPGRALQVELSIPRAAKLPVDDRAVQSARRRSETRLDHILRYARSITCRRRFLMTYFGEVHPERCGTCDVCLGRHRAPAITPEDEPLLRRILDRIDRAEPRDAWFEERPAPRYHIDDLINWLVQEEYLRLEAPLEGTFRLTDKARALLQRE